MDSLDIGLWVIVIAFVVIVTAIVLLITSLQRRARVRAWAELAAKLGLVCESGRGPLSPVVVRGDYRGRALTLDTYYESQGAGDDRSTQTYTRVAMPVNNPTGLRLELSKEGVLNKVGKRLGAQDIQIGDPELDQRLIIKGQPEEKVKHVLASAAVRQPLLSVSSLDVQLAGSEIRYKKPGVERDEECLRNVFDLMAALAAEVEQAA